MNLKKLSERLLIIGIAGELACLGFSLAESAKLNKEAEVARLETAKLKQQIAQTSAKADETKYVLFPRSLESWRDSAQKLSVYAGVNVSIVAQYPQPDRIDSKISGVLAVAKWKILGTSFRTNVSPGIWIDAHISKENPDPKQVSKLQKAATAVWNEFNFNGLAAFKQAGVISETNIPEGFIEIRVGGRGTMMQERWFRELWNEEINGKTNIWMRENI